MPLCAALCMPLQGRSCKYALLLALGSFFEPEGELRARSEQRVRPQGAMGVKGQLRWPFIASFARSQIPPRVPFNSLNLNGSGSSLQRWSGSTVGRLWGLWDESREEIGRHLSILQFERTPVALSSRPPRIVASSDGNVCVGI